MVEEGQREQAEAKQQDALHSWSHLDLPGGYACSERATEAAVAELCSIIIRRAPLFKKGLCSRFAMMSGVQLDDAGKLLRVRVNTLIRKGSLRSS